MPSYTNTYWTERRLMELRDLVISSPLTIAEIAEYFDSNIANLRTIMYNNKLKLPKEKHNRAKITASDLIIISLMIDKFSASVIAKKIGCSRRTIQRYIREIKEKRKQ